MSIIKELELEYFVNTEGKECLKDKYGNIYEKDGLKEGWTSFTIYRENEIFNLHLTADKRICQILPNECPPVPKKKKLYDNRRHF